MDISYRGMTPQMTMLFADIVASLEQLPDDRRIYLFQDTAETLDMEWLIGVAEYITFEFIKYSFDASDSEFPIRHFIDDDDSERMLQSRIMQYILKYKEREISDRGIALPDDHKFADRGMDSIDKKLKGHRLTEMNFFEQNVIHDLELVKSIVEKRIVSSKKVSNDRFQEIFLQYDRMVEDLIEKSKKSDADMVFSTIAFFTFEWHYPIEMFYYLSCLMEEKGIRDIDARTLKLLCSPARIESQFGGWVITDSRMVKERLYVLDFLFDGTQKPFDIMQMVDLIKEILVLCTYYREIYITDDGEPYKEWFRKESGTEDWASFLRIYDIFAIWQKKEWTRTRIQNMRKLIDITTASPL